ncbi:MAG: hypothetical protein MI741_17435, partial [Rhodospirillales bacterium]|nr:hypothetical protein [Rhodospirillales bacterium]
MSDPRRTVGFEVYVLREGRWEIYARYGPDGRDIAIRRAKEINRNPGIMAVRVVHEIFDSIAEISEEHTVYKSRQKPTHLSHYTAAEDARTLLQDLKTRKQDLKTRKAAAPVAEPISGLARITVSALMIGFA